MQVRGDGLLWVWAEGGPGAEAEAAATSAVAPAELDAPGASLYLSSWFMRDVPYGADTLVGTTCSQGFWLRPGASAQRQRSCVRCDGRGGCFHPCSSAGYA